MVSINMLFSIVPVFMSLFTIFTVITHSIWLLVRHLEQSKNLHDRSRQHTLILFGYLEQAGAELCQAQVKQVVIVDVVEEAWS